MRIVHPPRMIEKVFTPVKTFLFCVEGEGFGRSGALRSKAELATAPLSSATIFIP